MSTAGKSNPEFIKFSWTFRSLYGCKMLPNVEHLYLPSCSHKSKLIKKGTLFHLLEAHVVPFFHFDTDKINVSPFGDKH